MDDLTKLMSSVSGDGAAGGTDPMAALSGLQQAVQQEGGIDALMGKLKDAGLGDQVDSWVGTGENQPVDPAALGQALGPDTVQRLSAGSGIDVGKLLPMLAAFLPQIINMLTPHGKIPEGGLGQAAGNMDIGGLLGGLLGGAGGAGGTGGSPDLGGMLGGLLGGDKG
jgi:uncharacterized protein YidB (DUF937 family)